MNNFKKTLLAASVLGMATSSFGAQLGTTDKNVALTVLVPSIQEVATRDKFAVAGPILVLGANYGTGDTITATYSGAAFDSAFTFPTAAISGSQATDGGTGTPAICGAIDIAFAGLAGSVATFTVGAVTGVTIDCALALPSVDVDGASLATADTLKVAITTSRGFGTLESVAATTLANVGIAEITSKVTTKFNGVIDVNDDRYTLTDGAASPSVETTDVATFTLADAAGGADLKATSTMTLTGDFSWAASTSGTPAVTTYPQVVVSTPTAGDLGAVTKTATSVSWVATDADVYTVTLTPPTGAAPNGKVTLPATDYAFSSSILYNNSVDTAKTVTETATGVGGAWTLNGASITALGVSNSPSVTPMIWVQNSGTSNGAISGSVNCNGTVITIADLGTAAAKSNTKVGEAIQAAVDANGTCSTVNTRYDATVTVNGPAADITMNASYKVTAADGATDRVMLETSDSLPSVSN